MRGESEMEKLSQLV